MIIQNNTIQHPLKTSPARPIGQPFSGCQLKTLQQDTFEKTSFAPAFLGQNIRSCQKDRLTTGLAYTWAKTARRKAFIQKGNLNALKYLKDNNATVIFMCKHYGGSDFPSFIKLLADVSDGPMEFHRFYPHLMRGKDARQECFKTSVLKRIDKGLGAFLVDNTGGGKGKEALMLSLDLVEAGKNIVIFPESGSPLKKKNDPVSRERQVVEPIHNGIAHIVARYLDNTKEGKTSNQRKVYVVPIGISGENAGKTTSSSIYVGKPINVTEELAPVVAGKAEYYDKIAALKEVFQKRLQDAQTLAYTAYINQTERVTDDNDQESPGKVVVNRPAIQNFA